MAYTFGYDVVAAVTMFMNGDELFASERETLINLANAIRTSADNGWPSAFDDDDEDEEQ